MNFALLNARVRQLVRRRIDNGEYTERGFARLIGISQPQMHNILKGERRLSPEIADIILSKLQISVASLFCGPELPGNCGHCTSEAPIARKGPGTALVSAAEINKAG